MAKVYIIQWEMNEGEEEEEAEKEREEEEEEEVRPDERGVSNYYAEPGNALIFRLLATSTTCHHSQPHRADVDGIT